MIILAQFSSQKDKLLCSLCNFFGYSKSASKVIPWDAQAAVKSFLNHSKSAYGSDWIIASSNFVLMDVLENLHI